MVSVAPASLTKVGFRRDVKLFLTFLVGFLILLIFTLVFVLRNSFAHTEAMIDRNERTVTEIALGDVNRTEPSALDAMLVSLRGRFNIAGIELELRDGRRIASGRTRGEFDDVQRLAGPGTLILHFDASQRQALRRRFILTSGICVAAASLGIALLLLYLPRILLPIERLAEIEKMRADDLERVTAALTRSLTSGLIAVDAAGHVVDVNAAGREILGIDPSAGVAGRATSDVVPLPRFAGALAQAYTQQEAMTRVELEDVRPDREAATIGLTTVPLRNETGEFLGFLALFTDLTPIRSLEARVQEMQTLAQLGEISAGIAHELRNSVNTILGYMKLARRGGVDEAADGRLQSAEKEAALLLQAVERLLTFARPLPLNTEPVDLRELAGEQVRQLGETAGGDVRLEIDGPHVVIDADRVLLARAIENLLRNAIDAVREKGRGSVRVHVAATPPTLTINDDGAGFDPAETPRLFLPFHSNKPSGFGMGLPLAKKIVLLHGGTLRLTGEPGQGAVAVVTFRNTLSALDPRPSSHKSA